MKKLSVMAVVVAATCMLAACGKQGTVNSQPAGESLESVESLSSEAQESSASEEGTEEISESGKSKEEKVENAWTDGNTTVEDQDALSLLASLDTDYSKVYWGVSYSVFEDLPGLVVSLTPCMQYDSYGLVVAITNLYDEEMTFAGNAVALDSEGNEIGETYIFEPNIGTGNTAVAVIDCGQSMPDGRVQWTECETMETTADYVPWEADYQVSGNPAEEYLSVDYTFYASEGTACEDAEVIVCLLDEDGLVIGVGSDYISEIGEGGNYGGTINVYGDKDILALTQGVAMFANPYAVE